MKNRRNIMRKTKFILCCALFTFICVFGSAAAFAEGDNAALLDRNGEVLTAENFPYYADALDTFNEYISTGNTVKLTVDLDLQEKILNVMNEDPVMGTKNAALSAVVLDIETGAPLALINRGRDPLNSCFAPHQLFLPCTALAALSHDIVRPDTVICCDGVFTRYEDDGIAPACWIWNAAPDGHLTHPEENLRTALRDSCYYYFYTLGNDLGIDALSDYARSLGLGEDTGIELLASKGVLASREQKTGEEPWHIGDTLEAAVGRSVSDFTPLQYARYIAAIANGGKGYSTSIVNEIVNSERESVYTRQPQIINETSEMNEVNWDAVREGLYIRLNDPLNSSTATKGCVMAGSGSSYYEGTDRTECIFIGYAPYDAPRYAIVVTVNTMHDIHVSAQELAYEIMDICME